MCTIGCYFELHFSFVKHDQLIVPVLLIAVWLLPFSYLLSMMYVSSIEVLSRGVQYRYQGTVHVKYHWSHFMASSVIPPKYGLCITVYQGVTIVSCHLSSSKTITCYDDQNIQRRTIHCLNDCDRYIQGILIYNSQP